MVAASSKTTQSFVLALSGWIGTRVPCDFLLKMLMNKAFDSECQVNNVKA
jgi:hypothetical protein